ncbi:MAG: hypothetical protein NC311_08140 [Muribaculaceae bacterium]|nr:hypothetical protein [Muribaculaceae bacterium]MCM1439331.1 hypothetical protein [Roseburia sp.]
MIEGRSVTLDVRYRNTPYSQQAAARSSAGASGSSAEAGAVAGAAAGTVVTLNKTPLYVSSTATSPAGYKSGAYYLYDGILIRGRYRITNTIARCGKKPVGQNVTGWVNAGDCGLATGEESEEITDTPTPLAEGAETGTDITEYVESMTYTDSAADASDTIDLTVDAQDGRWMGEWMPQKGATLRPRALGHNWEKPRDERAMECGLFVVDDVSYSDTPTTLQVGGVSKPSDTDFSDLERTTTWKNTSIKRIGQTIAKRYGLGFSYDGEDYDIECEEQDGADSSFYNTLCKNYGLLLKVYAGRLWVYDREAYKAKPTVATIDRTDIQRGSMSWNTTLSGTYTGGTFSYTDPDKDCDISCSIGGGSRIKAVNRRATSVQDAAVQLCAELNNANHGTTKLKFTLPGAWEISAANNIQITGYGDGPAGGSGGINGKYFVDKVTHKFNRSGGFTTEVECSAVTEGFHAWAVGGSIQHSETATGTSAQATTKPAESASSEAAGASAGDTVQLQGAPLYVSSTAKEKSGTKTGTYYLYDGVLVSGRYRITNTRERCGKLPVGQNVTGWVPASYCTTEKTAAASMTKDQRMELLT